MFEYFIVQSLTCCCRFCRCFSSINFLCCSNLCCLMLADGMLSILGGKKLFDFFKRSWQVSHFMQEHNNNKETVLCTVERSSYCQVESMRWKWSKCIITTSKNERLRTVWCWRWGGSGCDDVKSQACERADWRRTYLDEAASVGSSSGSQAVPDMISNHYFYPVATKNLRMVKDEKCEVSSSHNATVWSALRIENGFILWSPT